MSVFNFKWVVLSRNLRSPLLGFVKYQEFFVNCKFLKIFATMLGYRQRYQINRLTEILNRRNISIKTLPFCKYSYLSIGAVVALIVSSGVIRVNTMTRVMIKILLTSPQKDNFAFWRRWTPNWWIWFDGNFAIPFGHLIFSLYQYLQLGSFSLIPASFVQYSNRFYLETFNLKQILTWARTKKHNWFLDFFLGIKKRLFYASKRENIH